MTPIFTIMLIFSYDGIEKKVEEKLTEYGLRDWIGLIKDMDKSIGDYIIVTMKDSMIVGICSYIIFFFLKLEYSSLFALIIGIGNVIPFIGPFIGLIPVIMYAMTKSFQTYNNDNSVHNYTSDYRSKYNKTMAYKSLT